MKNKTRLAWLSTLLVAALTLAPAAMADDDKTFFYNITTDQTWRAGMAIGQGTKALEAGYDVVLLLNVRGVRLAATAGEQDVFGPSGETPRQMLKTAADKGARIVMCPMCMERAGLEMDDLISEAERGGPDVTFELMAGDDTVVMSY